MMPNAAVNHAPQISMLAGQSIAFLNKLIEMVDVEIAACGEGNSAFRDYLNEWRERCSEEAEDLLALMPPAMD